MAVQYMNIIFVCNEELKMSMQGYSLCLLGNQLKFQLQPFGCDVNVRAHLLRNNHSRNFSSIRSGPWSYSLTIRLNFWRYKYWLPLPKSFSEINNMESSIHNTLFKENRDLWNKTFFYKKCIHIYLTRKAPRNCKMSSAEVVCCK